MSQIQVGHVKGINEYKNKLQEGGTSQIQVGHVKGICQNMSIKISYTKAVVLTDTGRSCQGYLSKYEYKNKPIPNGAGCITSTVIR